MRNIYPELAVSKNGEAKQFVSSPIIALARTTKENNTVSSILLLGHNTTEIEVSAHGGSIYGVAGKWLSRSLVDSSVAGTSIVSAAAGTPNYDFIVPNGQVRRFAVPISTFPQTAGSVQGVNREQGLYPAIAYIATGGVGSVLTVEF